MPYETNEPAAWWRHAEAAPPVPEGEGLWELAPTPYGYAWRRPEPTVSTHDRLRAGLEALHAAAPPVPAEVRVGDRVKRAYDDGSTGSTAVVQGVGQDFAALKDEHGWQVLLRPMFDIGPPGSGKPWTLLPPVPAPDAVVEMRLPAPVESVEIAGCVEFPPGADTAKIAAGIAVQMHAGGGGGIGPHHGSTAMHVVGAGGVAGCSGLSVDPAVRIYSSDGTLIGVAQPGTTFVVGMPPARAADAVPDPRREAERRVVEAARAWARPDHMTAEMEAADALDAAVRALDALDGGGGG